MRISLSLLLLSLWFTVSALRAQSTVCNQSLLESSSAGALAYQDRHDRCEGLFALPVSSSARLDLVSVTDSFPLDLEPKSLDTLHLVWKAPAGSSDIKLRANSLRYKLYYEMDATSKATKGTFDWKMDILKQVDVRRPEIGLLASATLSGPKQLHVYLPLAASRQPATATIQKGVEIVLIPTVELSEVYYSVAKLGPDGSNIGKPSQLTPLNLGYYPHNRPIRLQVPIQSGSYDQINISATVAEGGTTGTTLRIYYAR